MQPLHPTADSVSIADILSACMLALHFPPFVVPAPRAPTFYARRIHLGKFARASFAVLLCFDLFIASWSSACCWRAAGVEENNDVSILMSASVFPPIRMPHGTCKLCTCLSLFLSVLYYALLLGLHRSSAICVLSPPPRGIFLKLFDLIIFPLKKNFNLFSLKFFQFVCKFERGKYLCVSFFLSFSVLGYAIPNQVCSPSLQSIV